MLNASVSEPDLTKDNRIFMDDVDYFMTRLQLALDQRNYRSASVAAKRLMLLCELRAVNQELRDLASESAAQESTPT